MSLEPGIPPDDPSHSTLVHRQPSKSDFPNITRPRHHGNRPEAMPHSTLNHRNGHLSVARMFAPHPLQRCLLRPHTGHPSTRHRPSNRSAIKGMMDIVVTADPVANGAAVVASMCRDSEFVLSACLLPDPLLMTLDHNRPFGAAALPGRARTVHLHRAWVDAAVLSNADVPDAGHRGPCPVKNFILSPGTACRGLSIKNSLDALLELGILAAPGTIRVTGSGHR